MAKPAMPAREHGPTRPPQPPAWLDLPSIIPPAILDRLAAFYARLAALDDVELVQLLELSAMLDELRMDYARAEVDSTPLIQIDGTWLDAEDAIDMHDAISLLLSRYSGFHACATLLAGVVAGALG